MPDRKAPARTRRLRLRSATAKIHQSIDHRVGQAKFLVTRPGYNAYLRATLRARRAVEGQLEVSGVAAVYPPWRERKLADALVSDLADVGTPLAQDEPPDAMEVLSEGGIWGALYVLEGSALGARLIQRRVADLDMTAEFGARHLARQTADPAAWTRFLDLLEDADLTADEEQRCISASLATFLQFERSYEP